VLPDEADDHEAETWETPDTATIKTCQSSNYFHAGFVHGAKLQTDKIGA
jgi:hypothetical protein